MIENKYISIDKSVLAEGCSYNFSLYYTLCNTSQVKELKPKGTVICDSDLLYIQEVQELFVNDKEHHAYEEFYKTHLQVRPNKIKRLSDSETNLSKKLNQMYENASIALNQLFEHPDKLSNYQESKQVVNHLVKNVLDGQFVIKSLMQIATHDYYTHTHSINVAIYALSLGHFLGFTKIELEELGESALLHDLGKSKIDTSIINKQGRLTANEFQVMKKHPIYGTRLCINLGITNKNVLHGVKYHHEKMNGSGYPDGLYGDEIPFYAKIIGICDIFDALTSQRSYKKAMSSFEALKLMKTDMKEELDIDLLNKMILMFR